MAKQCGPIPITGTIDDVCFYRMNGKYYARLKSSLTRKRVLKDAAFRRTREHAATLGEASKIASRVYRLIPRENRKQALYREMTGKAIYLLREEKGQEEVFQSLSKVYLNPEPLPEPKITAKKSRVKTRKEHYTGRSYFPAPKLKERYRKHPYRRSRLLQSTGGRRICLMKKFALKKNCAMGP